MLTDKKHLMHCEYSLHYLNKDNTISIDEAGIILQEIGSLAYYDLRGRVEDEVFQASVQQAFGLVLPKAPRSSSANEQYMICWLSPDEWFVIDKQNRELASFDKNTHCSFVDVSSGYTCLRVSGSKVQSLLMHSCIYDLSPGNFKIGQCVQTKFAQASALICNQAENTFDLIIRRSFADYIGLWCFDASSPYGCIILDVGG